MQAGRYVGNHGRLDKMKLYHADAFEVLPQLEEGSFDAVIADPPYSSGGKGMAQLRLTRQSLSLRKIAAKWGLGT